MKFEISKEIFESFPRLSMAVIVVRGIDNTKEDADIISKIKQRSEQIRKELSKDKLSELDEISVWRKAYSSFGAKPKKYKASIEALLRRILDGEELPSINKLVDMYNYVSIKHLLPVGGDNLDKVEGNIMLKKSKGSEKFVPLGSSDHEEPKENEIVYADDSDVLCRRWNWRECDKTKLDENTSDIILYAESLVGKELSEKVMSELIELIKDKFGVEAIGFVMDQKKGILDIDNLKLIETNYSFEEQVQEENVVEKTQKKDKKSRSSERKTLDPTTVHWADQIVRKLITAKGEKEKYTVASGITPSGVVHIGNFREIITVDLVARALISAGKKVRFIYSWDEYDVFRKVPKNMPNQEMLHENLRKSIIDVPDPFETDPSYAEHHERAVEDAIKQVGIHPEFLYQARKYRAFEYADGIKIALQKKSAIISILDKWRKEPLGDDWWPVTGFCSKCEKDHLKFSDYDGQYGLKYECTLCGFKKTVDLRKDGELSLKWRVDWPMRWAHEKVDFEPGGKDHSTVGGSYTTSQEIVKLYDWTAPFYQMYDFIRIKGGAGKISSSSGDVITLQTVLDIYEPEIARWLFAGTRPNAEFAISFDLDTIKIYEDFDKCERIYFGVQTAKNEREELNQKRIYELSMVDKVPSEMPAQISFRHLTSILQINEGDLEKTKEFFKDQIKTPVDEKRFEVRAKCAWNWIETYAPEEMKFRVQKKPMVEVSDSEAKVLKAVASVLKTGGIDEKGLHDKFYELCKAECVETKDFFKAAYGVLINKEKGPKLAAFVLELGDRAIELFEKV